MSIPGYDTRWKQGTNKEVVISRYPILSGTEVKRCVPSEVKTQRRTVSDTFCFARLAAARVEDRPGGAKLSVDCVALLPDNFAVAFFAGVFAGAFLVDWLRSHRGQ